MINGFIPLHKEVGMTSFACVAAVRKIVKQKRIGHGGTLDPDVDGVLPICLGVATKLVNRLQTMPKTYTGQITLGFATDTEDLSGQEIARERMQVPMTNDQIDAAFASFQGDYEQTPPLFSAVRVNGRHLYEYARAGESVERPRRLVHVYQFSRTTEPVFDAAAGEQTFSFTAKVSKGTYIRTLASDLGTRLHVPAVMSQLTRQSSGGFQLADTVTIAELDDAAAADRLNDYVQPIQAVFTDVPHYDLNSAGWERVQHGNYLKIDRPAKDGDELFLRYRGDIQAIYQYAESSHTWRAELMLLHEVEEKE